MEEEPEGSAAEISEKDGSEPEAMCVLKQRMCVSWSNESEWYPKQITCLGCESNNVKVKGVVWAVITFLVHFIGILTGQVLLAAGLAIS